MIRPDRRGRYRQGRWPATHDSIPTGRLRRTARLGGLAGGQAARSYAGRAADLTRSEEQRRAAAEKRQLQAAERVLDVLGQMKGAAMKLGQVASFVDTGALPKEAHERLEAKLAKLRDSAPRVSFEQMRKVIESDLGQPLEDVFEDFETEAFAAASIGQVYRARLRDGRRVAVKVQYPGIAQRCARGRAEPRDAAAGREDAGARDGPEGDGAGDSRAPHRGARLRGRGPDAPHVRADVARAIRSS